MDDDNEDSARTQTLDTKLSDVQGQTGGVYVLAHPLNSIVVAL